jgi:predicted acetyltransferase
MPPFLTPPHVEYRESYLAALREFHAEGRNLEQDYATLVDHFPAYVRELATRAYDRQVSGRVPETFYWLIDDGIYCGRLTVRHYLTAQLLQFGGHIGYEIRPSQRRQGYGRLILKLGLVEARAHGITRALITCDDTNIASARIIEANGGQLENIILLPHRKVPTRRYWIELAPPAPTGASA